MAESTLWFAVWLNYGIMALIPFGGTVGIVLTTVLVALQDVWLGLRVLIAAVHQVLRTWLLPVLGSVTGLKGLGSRFGFDRARIGGLLGVIVAVPTAVHIKRL